MDSRSKREETLRVAERAAEWLITLEDGGNEEHKAFAEWVAASPQHLKEFLLVSALDNEMGHVDPQRQLRIGEILERAGNVVTLAGKKTLPSRIIQVERRLVVSRWVSGLAAVCAIVTAVSWWALGVNGETYQTSVGEQKRVELADGSVVQLNTGSRIKIEFTDTAREIRLVSGEALFKVEKDAARPFRVRSDTTVIQALGTQFNVTQRPSGTVVSVLEGAVKVYEGAAENSLAAGEEARIDRHGTLQKRKTSDLTSLAAWRANRLVFRDDTLEDIAAEFNRYNKKAQIRLAADEVKSRRYTAVFDADDPDSLVLFIKGLPGLSVERSGDAFVVRADAP